MDELPLNKRHGERSTINEKLLLSTENDAKNHDHSKKLYLSIDDVPTWPTAIFTAVQQVIVCTSGVAATPLIIADLICAGSNALAKVKLIGTMIFVTGLSTVLQTTFGTRLPLIQGPSFTYFPPILAMVALPEFRCSKTNHISPANNSIDTNPMFPLMENITTADNVTRSDDGWIEKMQIIQGGLVTAAIVETIIGATGLVGLITRFVGPLTIAPLMLLLEFSAFKVSLDYASMHWISIVATCFLVIMALYLNQVKVPIPKYDKRNGCTSVRFPLFAVFAYLLTIGSMWIFCAVMTWSNVFDEENHAYARTDRRGSVIAEAPWFRIPYPGQFGMIRFNTGVILGMLAGCVSSIVESIGDYHACARVCHVSPPPFNAVNRGILMEGIACVIGGFTGAVVGVTTYSENIGVIGVTKVACRRTMQLAGVIFMILGVFTKFGALLATLPDPLVGGIMVVSLSIIGGVGLSSVQLVDLSLSRNAAILGLSIMMGLLIPEHLQRSPMNTGYQMFDQLLTLLFSIHMFVGGLFGFILDNTIPGATRKQRGMPPLEEKTDEILSIKLKEETDHYRYFPSIIKPLQKCILFRHLPFLPNS